MKRGRIAEIENCAMDVLQQSYDDEDIVPPIDLSKVVDKSGLTIKVGQFKDPEIDGAYNREGKTIFLKKDAPYVRQAFTAAHELGHYYLHEDKTKEVFYRRTVFDIKSGNDLIEQEANWFAASLLMPKSRIKSFWEIFQEVGEIAKRFGVSYSAAYWRIKNLGLL